MTTGLRAVSTHDYARRAKNFVALLTSIMTEGGTFKGKITSAWSNAKNITIKK